MIACAFTEYTTICTRGAGGVKRTAGIPRSKVASITFTTGEVISDITCCELHTSRKFCGLTIIQLHLQKVSRHGIVTSKHKK
jgi:hypothetical protein